MAKLTPIPPKWADQFLEWYCKPELLEAIQGDMWERFEAYAEERGVQRAKLWYVLQVCLFINIYTLNMKHLLPLQSFNLALLQSYFKTGYRNALRNPWSTSINLIGLALATGCIFVVFVFVDTFFSNDTFHENLEEIYVVERVLQRESEAVMDGLSPEPLGPAILGAFPQISDQSRYTSRNAIVKMGDEVFSEWVSFADTGFTRLFSFPVKWGNSDHFVQPNDVIISEAVSQKYFGDANPVGKELEVIFQIEQEEKSLSFFVRAVLEKHPSNASFGFNLLFPYHAQLLLGKSDFEDWQSKVHATFLQIPDKDQISTIEDQLDSFLALENEKNTGWPTHSYHFHPLKEISLHSNGVENSFFVNAHIIGIIMIVSIALIILLQVCFTYVNSNIALLSGRMQEISFRKVLGGKRKQIAFQFLFENLAICILGTGIGILLARLYFIPWFSTWSTTDLSGYSFSNPFLLSFGILLIGVLVLGGAGYPAVIISKLNPKAISRGNFKLKRNSFLKKSLLGVQFSFTFLALFATFALFQHSKEIKQKNWGYEPTNKLVLRLPNGSTYETLAQSFSSLPGVESVSGSIHQIGKHVREVTVQIEGEERNVQEMQVGSDYLQKMGVSMLKGNFPQAQEGKETSSHIWINEEFSDSQDLMGSSIKMEGATYIVSGIVKNFRQRPFDSPIRPMVFKLGPEQNFQYMTLFLVDAATPELMKKLREAWYEILPFSSFEYFFQDEVFHNYFRAFDQINDLLAATTGISILISLMSLLGILMLSLSQKMKEISIRKVLGAGNWDIGKLLNKEFMWPQVISFLIGAPMAFMLVKGILSAASPEFNSPNFSPFLYALVGILGISFFSIYVNLIRLRQIDPVEFLRSE